MNKTTLPEGNLLQYEKSPYLLQHTGDPVDWRPWCPGALTEARKEPIFLSIGYSTCHWCHVMGKESFRDPEVAAVLNRDFIPVKVDREERPDIDGVYMAACQALTGTGGWPLTLLLTPEQEPFWAGTYLPPRSREGQLGLLELLDEAGRLWHAGRQELLDLGREVTRHISRMGTAADLPPSCWTGRRRSCWSALIRYTEGSAARPSSPFPTRCSSCWSMGSSRETRRPGRRRWIP